MGHLKTTTVQNCASPESTTTVKSERNQDTMADLIVGQCLILLTLL